MTAPSRAVGPGDRLGDRMPLCDTQDPAHLEAWYGPGGFVDPLRKVTLANCKEIVRARYATEKISETRIDDLAHLHDNYLDFLITCLQGRITREDNVRASLGVGA